MICKFFALIRRKAVPEPAPVTDWRDRPRMIAKASMGQRRSRAVVALYERNHTILDNPDRVMPYQPVGKARAK